MLRLTSSEPRGVFRFKPHRSSRAALRLRSGQAATARNPLPGGPEARAPAACSHLEILRHAPPAHDDELALKRFPPSSFALSNCASAPATRDSSDSVMASVPAPRLLATRRGPPA